ncbi:E3 ubiquitin-protein ligase TRIM7-like [Hyperolius riggenbachi]|uniref:E3 ubiquitin-protein ligase TRIM7-like n=1 Tax=Hyperolius riggenbachi TaxID=752182 RepID=UPI0035A30C23
MAYRESVYERILLGSRNSKSRLNNYGQNNLNRRESLLKDDNGNSSQSVVNCTYCINLAVPAVKSCLLCEAALCEDHVDVHSQSPQHVLTFPFKPSEQPQSFKCSTHSKVMEYYCFEDAACLCVSCCLAGEHRGHKVEPLDKACDIKKGDLRKHLEKLFSQQRSTESRLLKLQQQKEEVEGRAALVTERVSAMFCNLRRQLEELERRVLLEIAAEEIRITQPFTVLIEQLEIQQQELSQNISRIEELINSADPISTLTKIPKTGMVSWMIEDRDNPICDLEDLDEGFISAALLRSFNELMDTVKKATSTSELLLDLETAANDVYVSGDKKTLSWTKINQQRPKIPNRFKSLQILSSSTFNSGRHYWEVQASQTGDWTIGVCYPSVERKGSTSILGNNSKSWCLSWKDKKLFIQNDQKSKHFLNPFHCFRVGIYLDYEAGKLSFYKVDEPIRHLHTFIVTFTEPLHAAFSIQHGWLRIKT